MIYLNNASTTYPKPQCVLDAHAAALCIPPAVQYRSSFREDCEDPFDRCKKKLGELLQIQDTQRIFMTSGATEAFNAVLFGLNLKCKKVITTQTEHNSVLRPLMNLYGSEEERNSYITILPCNSNGRISIPDLEKAITADTEAVIINHCSNVTGMIQDIEHIGRVTRANKILLIVDASQSAGCVPINVDEWYIDILVFTGHKGLFGPSGTGGCYVRRGIDLKPYRYGGTGRDSRQLTYDEGDYEYEVGTQNGPGIIGLTAGVEYVLSRGISDILMKKEGLLKTLYSELSKMPNVTVYGTAADNKGSVLSFNILNFKPSDVAYILQNSYDMIVRTGFHCAPLIHDALGTSDFGTVRVSISDMTTEAEIAEFVETVQCIQEASL